MKVEVINLCSMIEECRCSGCNANKFEDGTCFYCSNENIRLKQLTDLLLKSLSYCEVDEDILFALYKINNKNISEVSEVLQKNNFKSFIDGKFNDINSRLVDSYQNSDFKYLIYFMKNGFYDDNNIIYISNMLMSKLYCDEIDVSIEEKLKLISIYTENIMKCIHPDVVNPKCVIGDLKEDMVGGSLYNNIFIDKDEIIEWLTNKNCIQILNTIFHEATHTCQHYTINNKNSFAYNSYMTLLLTKENIIKTKIPSYYKENYFKYSSEVEARVSGNSLLLQFVSNNKLPLDQNSKDKMNKEIMYDRQLILDETRKLNGNSTSLDSLFDSLDLGSDVLDKYFILNFEYKKVNGKIVRKTKEELENEYNSYLNGQLFIEGNKEFVDYLYQNLIAKANKIDFDDKCR